MNYWLLKSEPNTWSWQNQKSVKSEMWDGVRNYQARNMMRNDMKKADLVFYYHSNCDVPGIVGVAEVAKEGYPDFTAFDPKDKHHDPDSDPQNPRWYMVDLRYKRKFKRIITLSELHDHRSLSKMRLLQKGNRLSVTAGCDQRMELHCQA